MAMKMGGSGLRRLLGYAVALIVVAVVGIVGLSGPLGSWISGEDAADGDDATTARATGESGRGASASGSDAEPDAEPSEPKQPPPPPPRRAFRPLQGCSCRANTDGERGRELVQLAVRPRGKMVSLTSSGQHMTWKLEFYLDVAEDTSHFLPTEEADAAPPYELKGSKADVGLGCSDEVVAIAAQGRVSGWSTEDGSLLWTAPVDGWRPSGGQSDSFELSCKSLRVRRGVVRVPEVGRRTTRIRMKTGEVL